MTAAAFLACAAWLFLLNARRGFWRADQRLPVDLVEPSVWPPVTAVVPARNEAATVGACVAALAAQDYPGRLSVIVVDDASDDGTAALARAAGGTRTTVLTAPPLAEGWTGKLAALDAGVAAAGDVPWLWFTDADVVHGPLVLRRLMSHALQRRRDLASLMVKLRCDSAWERLLVPAFVFFFQMLYPFRAVNDDRARAAAAAGGCVLLRRDALARAGGLAAIRGAVIDDCTLARAVKDSGGALWLGLADDSRSLRAADSLAPLWRMVERTAFTQLHYSFLLLAGTVAGLALVFLAPPAAVLHGLAAGRAAEVLAGGAGWLLMVRAYGPTLAAYGQSIGRGFALPVAAALYALMTVSSALAHWRGRGGAWKGRHYDASARSPNLPKGRV